MRQQIDIALDWWRISVPLGTRVHLPITPVCIGTDQVVIEPPP